MIKNGVTDSIDVAPVITDGRTMVPLRFVSEQLGASVDWDASNNAVMIDTAEAYEVYTIKTGDTLWKIALLYGVSLDELLGINPGLNPDKLKIDQQINLPLKAGQEPETSTAAEESQSQDNSTDTETPEVSRGGRKGNHTRLFGR